MNIKDKFWDSINIGNNLISQVYQICLLQCITKPLTRSIGTAWSDRDFQTKKGNNLTLMIPHEQMLCN